MRAGSGVSTGLRALLRIALASLVSTPHESPVRWPVPEPLKKNRCQKTGIGFSRKPGVDGNAGLPALRREAGFLAQG